MNISVLIKWINLCEGNRIDEMGFDTYEAEERFDEKSV